MDNLVSKRISYVDVAKGIGIIAIVWGHVLRTGVFRTYLYAFNVPLFFLLLGYTFKGEGKLLPFVKKKFKRTMIPYYIWSMLSIWIFLLMIRYVTLDISQASTSFVGNVLGMVYANSRTNYMKWNLPLWFIPCMNAVLVSVFLIEKKHETVSSKNGKMRRRIETIAVCVAIGLAVQHFTNYKLLFQFETGIFMIAFVEMGIVIKECRIIEKLSDQPVKTYLIMVILLLVSIVLIQINGFAEIREYNYGNYPVLFFLYSSMLSVFLLMLSYRLMNSLLLIHIGKNSLPILLMHKFPILFFQSVFPLTKVLLDKPDTAEGMSCSVFVTLITIAMCDIVIRIIKHFVPWVIGIIK